MVRKAGLAALVAALILGLAPWSFPQADFYERQRLVADIASNRQPPPGTEFVFARVRFTSHGPGRRNFGPITECVPDDTHYGARICGWAHDYPEAEEHILQIADEATGINVNKESYVIVNLDSDELYKYPFAYFSEVGEMTMSEKEVEHMREFFNRGGFAIADDLDEGSLYWFENEMRRVFPNRAPVELTVDNSIFHTFYDMPTLEVQPPYPQTGPTRFVGYYDEHGRLIMLLNANNDMGDFWEWIDQPEFPLPPSTEALRFGINYFLYSLTH